MTLREHLQQLADELGLTLIDRGAARYRAALDRADWVVYLPDVDDEREVYWVGLHEVGHAATLGRITRQDWFDGKDIRGVPGTAGFTEDEAAAWAWALDHAMPEAFPLGQVGESNIAWSLTDYMSGHGWAPSPSFQRIYEAIGPEPDWYFDVTTDEHYRKLESWARPMWAELRATYGEVKV